jgi:hypothetical protein
VLVEQVRPGAESVNICQVREDLQLRGEPEAQVVQAEASVGRLGESILYASRLAESRA